MCNDNEAMAGVKRLRFGMIGGGEGAFIGAVHRIAAQMDGEAELVAGAFSSDAKRSMASAKELGVRGYESYEAMAEAERGRLDFVVIVTPNNMHFAPAKLFLERGFNVVLDKPLGVSVAEALDLRNVVMATGKVFVLTHTYAGNVMVKEARELVRSGALGEIRKVVVEYSQGWLALAVEKTGQKQAEWRLDPARGGKSGCMADIGVHAEHLARYVTGLRVKELCADLHVFGDGRRLDDDGNVLVRYEGGASGVLHASQVAIGEENRLSLRVYGTKASLEWEQEAPESLVMRYADKPREVLMRGYSYVSEEARRFGRVPAGHPEGYLEAFGNIYKEAFRAIRAEGEGAWYGMEGNEYDFPSIDDGLIGMEFIEACVASSKQGAVWVRL
jgi:predicted dehydrogenase